MDKANGSVDTFDRILEEVSREHEEIIRLTDMLCDIPICGETMKERQWLKEQIGIHEERMTVAVTLMYGPYPKEEQVSNA